MIVCDKCKKELDGLNICELSMESKINTIYDTGVLFYQLCQDCYEPLLNYVRNYKGREIEEEDLNG